MQNISKQLRTSSFFCQELEVSDTNYLSLIGEMSSLKKRLPSTFSSLNIVLNLSTLNLSDEECEEFLCGVKCGLDDLGHNVVGSVGVKNSISLRCGIKPIRKKIEKKQIFTEGKGLAEQLVEAEDKIVKLEPEVVVKKEPEVIESLRTVVINKTFRGGQQHYEEGANLVIRGDIKHGAEVAADGSITIFGKLEGRANAGAKFANATIMATHFDADLVSIGGVYLAHQNIPNETCGKSVLVELQAEEKKLLVHYS